MERKLRAHRGATPKSTGSCARERLSMGMSMGTTEGGEPKIIRFRALRDLTGGEGGIRTRGTAFTVHTLSRRAT